MATDLKEATIVQLTTLLIEQGKTVEDYQFKDAGGPYIYIIKNDGIRLMMGLIGFDLTDVSYDSIVWKEHKLSILKIFDKLDTMCKNIIENGKQDEMIDLMCNIDMYLSRKILDHFGQEKNGIKMTNPTMFSNMNIYMLTFKNLNVLKKFVESKLFYKVIGIV